MSTFQVALSSFYEDAPEPGIENEPTIEESSEDEDVVETGTAKKIPKKTTGYGNIATLSSVRDMDTDDDPSEKGQAFYAGGSEHSGQQILGPPPKKNPLKDMVSEVFKQAQAGNLEQLDLSHENPQDRFRSFAGTGYRLGQTDNDTVAVPSTSNRKKIQENCEKVTVKVYRQGFTVDDGDIRSYEEPRNREFFESITHNQIPAELRKQGKSMVHVNVEDHLSEDYVKKVPTFKAFTGSGHSLGSPTPPTTSEVISTTSSSSTNESNRPSSGNAENEANAASELNVNQDEASTMLSIRLADGSRLSTRFNLTHTVHDIHQYITTARPEYSGRSFMLLTTFPSKELSNLSDTIQQAGLQNAAILQRLK